MPTPEEIIVKISAESQQIESTISKLKTQLADLRTQFTTATTGDPKFMQQQGLLSRMYVTHSAQTKTLVGNLTALKTSLSNVGKEFHNTAVTINGVTKQVDMGSVGLTQLGVKADLVAKYFDNLSTRMLNAGKNMQWTGRQMMVGITAPIVGGAALAVKSYTDFEQVALRTNKLLVGNFGGQVAAAGMKELNAQANQLSETFGRFSAKDISSVQNLFASIGKGKDDIKILTELTTQFDVLGNVNNLETTANFVRTLFQAYGGGAKAVEETKRQMALLNEVDDKTNINMDQLIASVPKLFPLLKQFGVSASQTGALVTGLTQSGFDAVEGANALKQAFTKLPAAAAIVSGQAFDTSKNKDGAAGGRTLRQLTEIIKEFNKAHPEAVISFFDKQGHAANGVEQLKQVARAYGLMNEAQKAQFRYYAFGAQQGTKLSAEMQNLLDSMNKLTGGNTDLAKALDISGKAAGDIEPYERMKKELDTVLNDPSTKILGKTQALKNGIRNIGEQLAPVALKIVSKLVDIFHWFNQLSPGTKKFIGELAAGVAVIGPLVYVMGQLTIAASTLFKTFITKPTAALFGNLGVNKKELESLFNPTVLLTEAKGKFGTEIERTEAALARENAQLKINNGLIKEQNALQVARAKEQIIRGPAGGSQPHGEASLEGMSQQTVVRTPSGALKQVENLSMQGEVPTTIPVPFSSKPQAIRNQMYELINAAGLNEAQHAKAMELARLSVEQAKEDSSALGRALLVSGPAHVKEITDKIIKGVKDTPLGPEAGAISFGQIASDFKAKIGGIFGRSTKQVADSTVEQLALGFSGKGPVSPFALGGRLINSPKIAPIQQELLGLTGGFAGGGTTIRFNDEAKKINDLNQARSILRQIDVANAEKMASRTAASEESKNILGQISSTPRLFSIGSIKKAESLAQSKNILKEIDAINAVKEAQRAKEAEAARVIFTHGIMPATNRSLLMQEQHVNRVQGTLFDEAFGAPQKKSLAQKFKTFITDAIGMTQPGNIPAKLASNAPGFVKGEEEAKKVGGLLGGLGGIGKLVMQGGAIALLIIAFKAIATHWKDIQTGITNGIKNLKDAFGGLLSALVSPFQALFGAGKQSADQAHNTAIGWKSFGATLNGVMNAVATAIRVVTAVISPALTMLSGLFKIIQYLITGAAQLPAPIRNIGMALGALALAQHVGLFGSLFSKLTLFKGGITQILPNLRNFATGLSNIQAAAIAAGIALGAVSMLIGGVNKAASQGAANADKFASGLDKKYGSDVNDLDAKKRKLAELDAQYTKVYNNNIKNAKQAGNLNAWPWEQYHGAKGAERATKELEGIRAQFKGLQDEQNKEVVNLKLLGDKYHITTEEILAFAKAHNINLTLNVDKVLSQFDEARKQAQADASSGAPVELPTTVDPPPDSAIDKVKQYLKDNLMSAVQSSIQKMITGWRDEALKTFDNYVKQRKDQLADEEKAQTTNIDNQIKNIDRLIKAEEEQTAQEDYLANRKKLMEDRQLETNTYITQRDKALYEGDTSTAKQLGFTHQRAQQTSNDEEQKLEKDHAKKLRIDALNAQKQILDDQKQALADKYANLKDALDQELTLRKDQLQAQLDAITAMIPKNAAEAANMQRTILGTLDSFSGGYGDVALKNSEAWKTNWSKAMVAAHDDLYAKAWWAGDDALHQFAAALGVDVSVLQSATAQPAPAPASVGTTGPEPNISGSASAAENASFHHTGGHIGAGMQGAYDVPATLQTGEYVIQRKAVQRLGTNLLDTINDPRNLYHDGGVVGGLGPAMTDKFVNQIYNPFMGSNLKFGGKTGYGEMLDILRQKVPQAQTSFFGGLMGSIPAKFIGMFKGLPQGTLDLAQVMFGADPNAIITSTTTGKHAQNSYHYKGQAVDVVGNYGAIWNNLLPLAQNKTLAELFMDFFGGWKDGTSIGAIGGHSNHLHAAVADAFRNGFLAQMGGGGGAVPVGGLASWLGTALKLTNTDQNWLTGLIQLVMKESGGDPHSINSIGLNPRTGGPGPEHAEGILQMLPSTFMAHMFAGHGDIFNPIDNAMAAIDYIKGRYGSVYNTPLFTKGGKYGGYHIGGLVELMNGGKTLSDGVAMLHKGETVVDAPLTQKLERQSMGHTEFNLNFAGGYFGTDRELEKLVDTMERRVMPKINQARGVEDRTRSSIQWNKP